jgi:hypothetical protein
VRPTLKLMFENSSIQNMILAYLTPAQYFNISSVNRNIQDLTQRYQIIKFVDDRDEKREHETAASKV